MEDTLSNHRRRNFFNFDLGDRTKFPYLVEFIQSHARNNDKRIFNSAYPVPSAAWIFKSREPLNQEQNEHRHLGVQFFIRNLDQGCFATTPAVSGLDQTGSVIPRLSMEDRVSPSDRAETVPDTVSSPPALGHGTETPVPAHLAKGPPVVSRTIPCRQPHPLGVAAGMLRQTIFGRLVS